MTPRPIDDLLVLLAFRANTLGDRVRVDVVLSRLTGESIEDCRSAMEGVKERGLANSGTYLEEGWLTEWGQAVLAAAGLMDEKPLPAVEALPRTPAVPRSIKKAGRRKHRVQRLLLRLNEARAAKRYAEADRIRATLLRHGYEFQQRPDTPEAPEGGGARCRQVEGLRIGEWIYAHGRT